jgi:ABC-type sugar transport system ATPase subunit
VTVAAPRHAVPAVEVSGLGKWFGGTHALKGVSLTVEPGSVHSLVGENGAGKSTLLGVLAGRIAPSDGEVRFFGAPAPSGDPRAARRAGIVAIYQELTIVPAMTVAENVFLGRPPARSGWRTPNAMRSRVRELAHELGVPVDPAAPAGGLSIADQQLVEIMRALVADARIILFDEPTASLAAPERAHLHALMRRLKARGVTMVFVSHNLEEVLETSDEITVFRDGAVTRSGPAGLWTKRDLVRSMIGSGSEELSRALAGEGTAATFGATSRAGRRAAALRLEHVTLPGVLRDIDLEVAENEVLGIAGLVGSGRTSLLRAVAGLNPAARGRLTLAGRTTGLPRTVREARRAGIALVPEDRKGQGLVLSLSAAHNIAMSELGGVARAGWISRRAMTARAVEAAAPLAFDPARMSEPVRNLSGGNQQKALLSRWVYSRPRVLLADEPTRGIDIGAKAQIMAALKRFAAQGTTVLVASSEFEELIAHCDRIVVLARGRVRGEFRPGSERVTENDLLHAAFLREEQADG